MYAQRFNASSAPQNLLLSVGPSIHRKSHFSTKTISHPIFIATPPTIAHSQHILSLFPVVPTPRRTVRRIQSYRGTSDCNISNFAFWTLYPGWVLLILFSMLKQLASSIYSTLQVSATLVILLYIILAPPLAKIAFLVSWPKESTTTTTPLRH